MVCKFAQEIMANPKTATALVQALRKIKFEFPVDYGARKRCGVDFIKVEVPRNAKTKANRKKNKGKGIGKSSNKAQGTPGREGAQFLTVGESGDIVGATWDGSPPNHEAYQNNQRILQARLMQKQKLQNMSKRRKEDADKQAEKKADNYVAKVAKETKDDDDRADGDDQDQDQDVLELDLSKIDTEIFYANTKDTAVNNNNKKPEQSKVDKGPSGQKRERGEKRGRKREKDKETDKDEEKAEGTGRKEKRGLREKEKDNNEPRKIPVQKWIQFFPTKGTPNATIAAEENRARQLNVHGLPSEFLECSPGGSQEKALNQLLTKLGKAKIGDRGIDIEQGHIVGARSVRQTSSSNKSPIMRVTVDSQATKDRIIKAANITGRWGTAGGSHRLL